MDKGAEHNKRVWSLFAKAGFETRPNSFDPSEYEVELYDGSKRPLDLYARVSDLNVTLISSNKSREKLKSFTKEIHDLQKLRDAAKANAALFIAAEKEMRPAERNYALKNGIRVWDERQLTYYEAVAEAIGSYARYEIMHALDLPTEEEKLKDTVLAIKLRQPTASSSDTELFLFTMPADKLLKTCVVLRKAEGNAFAYQRILSKKRLRPIGTFLGTPEALLPTNLVVHLGEPVRVDEVENKFRDTNGHEVDPSRDDHKIVALTIPLKYGSLEVIDGQHRLFGFIHADDAIRRKFNLVVLGIKSLSEKRRCSTFVAINDNARRVDANLVSYLRYTSDEKVCKVNADLMAIKIAVELNKNSPFKDAIKLFDFGKQKLTLKGISGYDLRGLISKQGLLRKYYPANSTSVYVRALRMYYSAIRDIFRQEWDDPKTYIIATNRGVTAFLKLLRSILKTEEKKVTKPTVKKYMAVLKKNWKGTWESKKLRQAYGKTYVGSEGWAQFHRDLVAAIRKDSRLGSLQE